MTPTQPAVFRLGPQHNLGLSGVNFTELADKVESGQISLTELLLISTQASRLISSIPPSMKNQPAFRQPFQTANFLRLNADPSKACSQLADKLRELGEKVPELPPDDLPVPVHTFDLSMIPLIFQIIQMILDMITKFKS